MMGSYRNFREVIDAFGTAEESGAAVIERLLSLPRNYGYGLWNRDSIAPSHWDRLIELAAGLGVAGITEPVLMRLYKERRQRRKPAATSERKRKTSKAPSSNSQFGGLKAPGAVEGGHALERVAPTHREPEAA